MSITAISTKSFTGKIVKTDAGNEYEKNANGKKYAPLLSLASTAIALPLALNEKLFDIHSSINLGEAMDNCGVNQDSIMKAAKKIYIIGAIGVGLVGSFIVGAIIDALANKTKRRDADRYAATGEIPEKTNKGKYICGGISAVSTALGLMAMSIGKNLNVSHNPSTLYKVITSTVGIAVGTLTGAIYDYSVNKSRSKLIEKEVN